ncbi:3D domain-containing protein [Acetobacterium bakii]|uniref:G5 domain-containing protein n=1 Tax=Acetobacterium bakii TaxID=52689 RepID=A0A0L6U0A3_9FIRM|nr:3D domain-containing protein [Acetobacterium bakii]KNZ41941.1 hypothetical protein AKG39_10045 [Acetobacterium bakii]
MGKKEGESLFKGKKIFFRMSMIGLIIIFITGLTCNFAFAREVTVNVDGQDTTVRGSLFQNAEEILERNGIVLDPEETVIDDTTTKLVSVNTVKTNPKASGNLKVDGKIIPYETRVSTVEELLIENNIVLEELDRIEPSQITDLSKINEIQVIRVEVEQESIRKVIPFNSLTKDNAEWESNQTKVIQPGTDGVAYVVENILYENNVEVKRDLISEEVITAPIDEVIEVGTRKAPEKTAAIKTAAVKEAPAVVQTPTVVETAVTEETALVSETPAAAVIAETPAIPAATAVAGVKTILNCTAYTATGNATASGVMPQANHTIAAWSGLPFGTKVFVPSLGTTFTVEDRGGAVTDGIIDIYMNTYNECIEFGRQNLEAYISY